MDSLRLGEWQSIFNADYIVSCPLEGSSGFPMFRLIFGAVIQEEDEKICQSWILVLFFVAKE